MELREQVRVLVSAGWEVRGLAAWCGVSHPVIHRLLGGSGVSANSSRQIEAGLRRLAGIACPARPVEYPGVDDLAADHALLASLGATAGDVGRVRELLGTRQGALLMLVSLLAHRADL